MQSPGGYGTGAVAIGASCAAFLSADGRGLFRVGHDIAPLSCGPQAKTPGTTRKPALWAVSSSGLFDQGIV
jgi:hypothetical protein